MRLYPRKLNSVAELKKEKQRLLKRRRLQDKEDLLSFDDVLDSVGSIGNIFRTKKKKKKNEQDENGASIDYARLIMDLATSGFGVDTLIDLGLPLLNKFSPQIRRSVFKASKEVLGGYAKWKAIELSYRFIRRMLSKKHKAESTKRRAQTS